MRAPVGRQDRTVPPPPSYFEPPVFSNSKTYLQQSTQRQYVLIEDFRQSPIRSMSVPVNNRTQTSQPVQIEGCSGGKKERKYKIFQTNPTAVNKYFQTSENKKQNTSAFINGKAQTGKVLFIRDLIQQKLSFPQSKVVSTTIPILTRAPNRIDYRTITSPLQLYHHNNPLDNIPVSRANPRSVNKPYPKNILQQLTDKQQQVKYLKLEVERFRRCERLNKQNQALNKKIVQHIQHLQTANQSPNKNESSLHHSVEKKQKRANIKTAPLKQQEIPTPIQSLDDIRINQLPQPHPKNETSTRKSLQKFTEPILQNILLLYNAQEDQPQLVNTTNPEKYMPTEQAPAHPNTHFETITFQDETQSPRRPSPTKAKKNNEISLYIQNLHQTYHQTNRMAKTFIDGIPINRRLSQMNRILQTNYQSFQNRSKTKQQHRNPSPPRIRGKSSTHGRLNKIYIQ